MEDKLVELESSQLRDLYLHYGRVATVVSSAEEHDVYKLVEILKRHLRDKCDVLVKECKDQPLLFCYTADATSLLCRADASAASGAKLVMRRGKGLEELLMQRGFFKTRSAAGTERVAVLFAEAVPLSGGKSMWHLFSAAASFYPLLRVVGHKGISITHVAADRAVMASLQRLLRQRSEAYFTEGLGPAAQDHLSWLRTWHLHTGCAAHDIQNALKWGLASHGSTDVIKDLHIILESLRNSFTLIHERLPAFLEAHLVADMAPADLDAVMQFWQVLGVEADFLEEVAYVNPWFVDGALHVNAALSDSDQKLEKVSTVVLYLFRWRRFVDTRFCAIGPALRSVLASLAVGLRELVRFTREDAAATDYHLHGFARLRQPHLEYVVIASVCAWVPDAALFLVLGDDRLVRRRNELEQTLLEELSFLSSLSSFTWGRLAVLLGSSKSPQELQHAAMHAAQVACAYIREKASYGKLSN